MVCRRSLNVFSAISLSSSSERWSLRILIKIIGCESASALGTAPGVGVDRQLAYYLRYLVAHVISGGFDIALQVEFYGHRTAAVAAHRSDRADTFDTD